MLPRSTFLLLSWAVFLLLATASSVLGFQFQAPAFLASSPNARTTTTFMVSNTPEAPDSEKKEGYVPKWKKKQTLADEFGDLDYEAKGIKGTVSVVFQQGNDTKTTMAMPGQPLRDVATQAGQFIKYGCGRGECGTCESMCNGKWVRPCMEVVPATVKEGEDLVIQIKQVASKSTSSGKFFSVKSFFKGFWNNLLGMVGFVKYRRNAKKNWEERQEYEDLIRQKTLEKKLKRQQQLDNNAAADGREHSADSNGKLSP